MNRAPLLLTVTMLLAACAVQAGSSPSAGPTGGIDGVEELVAALSNGQAQARQGGTFDSAPLTGQGVLLCVGREEVRTYVYRTAQERAAAAGQIDPNDPSHIGSSIAEWMGNPRFWQSGRIIVLYLGSDARTEALLTSVMGPPFARGVGGGLGAPTVSAC